MAKLSTRSRNNLPKSSFGLPGKRAYPMPDKAHARNAKARASQQFNAGNLSAASKSKIDAKANRKLGVGTSAQHAHEARKASAANSVRTGIHHA